MGLGGGGLVLLRAEKSVPVSALGMSCVASGCCCVCLGYVGCAVWWEDGSGCVSAAGEKYVQSSWGCSICRAYSALLSDGVLLG